MSTIENTVCRAYVGVIVQSNIAQTYYPSYLASPEYALDFVSTGTKEEYDDDLKTGTTREVIEYSIDVPTSLLGKFLSSGLTFRDISSHKIVPVMIGIHELSRKKRLH